MIRLIPIAALGILFATAPAQASFGSRMLQERFKTVLNQLVIKVKASEEPEEKRAIMLRFVNHMQYGLERAQSMSSLTERDRRSLSALQNAFHAYAVELKGEEGYDRVQDMELDDYAAFMQQQMEQAPIGGGVYISGGALLILIILLVLLL